MSYADLIERLETAEVREPKKPSGQYVTTLGNQAAASLRELVAERDALQERYNDLLMQVGKKFPSETRHETARRYIVEAESHAPELAVEGKEC